jgi:hypothetical protein
LVVKIDNIHKAVDHTWQLNEATVSRLCGSWSFPQFGYGERHHEYRPTPVAKVCDKSAGKQMPRHSRQKRFPTSVYGTKGAGPPLVARQEESMEEDGLSDSCTRSAERPFMVKILATEPYGQMTSRLPKNNMRCRQSAGIRI